MKKDKKKLEQEVLKIKEKITKVLPNVDEVDIKVNKNEQGAYQSFIKVHIPKRKQLVACKRADNIKRCLEKSHQAISRQIHKAKMKSHRNKPRWSEMDLSA